jgi:hypothetical protein
MKGTARFDGSGAYRYHLRRTWGNAHPLLYTFQRAPQITDPERAVAFLMLNPSTADAEVLDPTVRRCIDYAFRWGYGALEVVNLFALRSPHPRDLYAAADPVGAANDEAILATASEVDLVVCAWGAHGAFRDRAAEVLAMLRRNGYGDRLAYLTLTQAGHPGHPLYLRKSIEPTRFESAPERP